MKIYAFDVDETLDISGGPIPLAALQALRSEGHCVGLCGNFAAVTLRVPRWHTFLSFIGPMGMTKADFLAQIKTYVPAEEVVMVGNIQGVTGSSADSEAAAEANVRFIVERDFAAGVR